MTLREVANVFHGRREGKGYRAKCPVHKSRGLSLSIQPHETCVGIHCFAGCAYQDILSAVGLTWKHLQYQDKVLSPEEKKAYARRKDIERQRDRLRRFDDIREVMNATKTAPREEDRPWL
jgi:hypothetical protein